MSYVENYMNDVHWPKETASLKAWVGNQQAGLRCDAQASMSSEE